MYKQFKGRTKEEAVQKAIDALSLESGEFDVEEVKSSPGSLFHRGEVTIRVYLPEGVGEEGEKPSPQPLEPAEKKPPVREVADFDFTLLTDDAEKEILSFLSGILSHMEIEDVSCQVSKREGRELFIEIDSDNPAQVIGKQGKTLNALQLLVRSYFSVHYHDFSRDLQVNLNTESYREKRESYLKTTVDEMVEALEEGESQLYLDPLPPAERRVVHIYVEDSHPDFATESLGSGYFKEIRLFRK